MDLASPSHPIQPVCCIRPSSGIYSFVISYLSELHLLSSPFSNLFGHLDNLIASIRPRVPPSLLSTWCLAERSCNRFCTFASLPVAPSSRLFLSGESCVIIPWRACIYTHCTQGTHYTQLHPTTLAIHVLPATIRGLGSGAGFAAGRSQRCAWLSSCPNLTLGPWNTQKTLVLFSASLCPYQPEPKGQTDALFYWVPTGLRLGWVWTKAADCFTAPPNPKIPLLQTLATMDLPMSSSSFSNPPILVQRQSTGVKPLFPFSSRHARNLNLNLAFNQALTAVSFNLVTDY